MGVRVLVRDGEPVGKALRRLKQLLELHNVPWEVRRRTYFIYATEERRAKQFQKRFKARKAALIAMMAGGHSSSSIAKAKADFWKRTGKP
jgi:ribosomal protein S21